MATVATQQHSVLASKLETELEEIDAGVKKDIPAATTLTVNGTALTPAQIDAKVQGYLTTIKAADIAKAQYQTAVVARRNIQLEARDFYLQLKKVIVAFFGAQSAQLADFGLTPAKAHAKRTAAQNAVQAAKAQLTREARGTKGRKQKAAINPMVGTPAVAINPGEEKPAVVPPQVVNPGSLTASPPAPDGSSTPAGSTPQGNAGGSGSTDASAPAPAGSGTPAK